MYGLEYLVYGWLSKLWSLFWVLSSIRHLVLGDPKGDPNFDNSPYVSLSKASNGQSARSLSFYYTVPYYALPS